MTSSNIPTLRYVQFLWPKVIFNLIVEYFINTNTPFEQIIIILQNYVGMNLNIDKTLEIWETEFEHDFGIKHVLKKLNNIKQPISQFTYISQFQRTNKVKIYFDDGTQYSVTAHTPRKEIDSLIKMFEIKENDRKTYRNFIIGRMNTYFLIRDNYFILNYSFVSLLQDQVNSILHAHSSSRPICHEEFMYIIATQLSPIAIRLFLMSHSRKGINEIFRISKSNHKILAIIDPNIMIFIRRYIKRLEPIVRKELRSYNQFKALYHKTSRALRYKNIPNFSSQYKPISNSSSYRNKDIDLLIADRTLVSSVLEGTLKRTIETDLACKRILKIYGGSSIDPETGKNIKSCHVIFNSLRKIYAALKSSPYREFDFDKNDDPVSDSYSDSTFEWYIKQRLIRS
jgi:hypothetical protein